MTSGPGPLSHSSATTLLGCEQRYAHYKILKTAPDPDYQKSNALGLGSAVHWILEKSRHSKPASITEDLEHCVKDPDIQLDPDDKPLAHGMVLAYLRLHQAMGLKVLDVELGLTTESFVGYIDAVMEDADGKFWICDLKTWKSLGPTVLNVLVRDPQMTLYAAHAAMVADVLKLDIKNFGGVRWLVVTKSAAKQQPREDYGQFIQRLVDKHLTAYDIPVPRELLDTDTRLETHLTLWKKAQALASGSVHPIRNYSNCMSYFSPCPYFSQCNPTTYSDVKPLNIYEQKGPV